VGSLERFQQSRAVIEDFSSTTLAAIPSDFGRLCYISSLKHAGTGRYEHDGLLRLYSENSVQEALADCHEEMFSRILETPLREQAHDLRRCLAAAGGSIEDLMRSCRTDRSFRAMCPDGLPGYLHELFCSNMGALLAIIASSSSS
jgi:hypothetical protein